MARRRHRRKTSGAAGDGTATARRGGPRRLADGLEGAWRWWPDAGRPEVYDFGMTVEP
ncbi:hypothetical protein V1L54_20240 [Streptomyces sp. TRM 70361]|uniref:hypothetical protein n=1 Tax=Streptomyces sp. TRM 70361 TaxID=3116553 RepID=UPI002E7AB2EA|nr:hypothetical protein [Streptomyces sp. TRM 70361]MEE1941705.1 hypothetical protein [Streptomyces sp. TRM 70361]